MTSLVGMACGQRWECGPGSSSAPKSLVTKSPKKPPPGVVDGRVEPALVDRVPGGVAGRAAARTARSAPGRRWGSGRRSGLTFVLVVRSLTIERVADAAGHQAPDLALVGAHLDAHAANAGIDDLEVALDVGAGAGVEDGAAVLVEDHGGRLAGEHVGPVLARVLAPPDAAGGPAQGGVDDHLAGGRELGVDDDLVDRVADEGPVARQRLGCSFRSAAGCRSNRR